MANTWLSPADRWGTPPGWSCAGFGSSGVDCRGPGRCVARVGVRLMSFFIRSNFELTHNAVDYGLQNRNGAGFIFLVVYFFESMAFTEQGIVSSERMSIFVRSSTQNRRASGTLSVMRGNKSMCALLLVLHFRSCDLGSATSGSPTLWWESMSRQ